jgi:purine-binding chemotaxis protein CheW
MPTQAGGRVAEMRTEFDSTFTRLPAPAAEALTDVLALRLGDEPCMLRLSEIAEVIAHPVITPVPTPEPALLGITAARGVPVAAYDLGRLLGRAPVTPHWLVLSAAEPGVGMVFEQFDGYRQFSPGPNGSSQLLEMAALINLITQLVPRRNSIQENE